MFHEHISLRALPGQMTEKRGTHLVGNVAKLAGEAEMSPA
jgi:hypothetical protein